MKKKTPEQQICEYAQEIVKSIAHWQDIRKNGCNDPGWPDGVNLNLVKNHVIYYKRQIRELCIVFNLPTPQEIYLPTPPVVDNNFFAKPRSDRAKRIMSRPGWMCANLEPEQKKYNVNQLTIF